MPDWRCRSGHLNPTASKACEECGEARGGRRATKTRQKRCDCGASVLASGLCSETGCYPASMLACPLACPVCRGPLEWDGGCHRCYGALDTRRRVEWCFPGDRFEVQGLHRLKIEGPRRCCAPEENRAALDV